MLNMIDLARADLNLLVLFETVMEERHVGRAAARLHLSPSAVSHGLGRLRGLFNDPLFLRTPKGVTPSERSEQLAAPVAQILAQVRAVVATAAPFDPSSANRQFTIGAPDGASAIFLPQLLDTVRRRAPNVDIRVRQLLPRAGEPSPALAWRDAMAELEARALDVAIVPNDEVPARFGARTLYEEDFVIAMRAGHPFARQPNLKNFCRARHLVVSHTGDPYGFVDRALALRRMSRRVALTVPNFMFALAVLASSDLIAALPRRFAAMYGSRFKVVSVEAPLRLPLFKLTLVTPKVALEDAGVAWLIECLTGPELQHRSMKRA
jgi:DNA-binding transcriptional LysR family regulator